MQVQELEVWYVIPAIRKELCKELAKGKLPQKEIEKRMGITGAAVSQYVNEKRAAKVKFSKEFEKELAGYAEKIAKGKLEAFAAVRLLTRALLGKKELCAIHQKMDKGIPKKCEVCFAPCGWDES